MTDLSIVLLNYNTKEMTIQCLETIRVSDFKRPLEVILVDNKSDDGSVVAFRDYAKKPLPYKIKIIENQANLGFAAGNNRGIRAASGRYILLLNTDVILEKDTLRNQYDFMESHPEYAASTCCLQLDSGVLDPACHRGFPTPWASLTYFSKLEKMFGKTKIFGQYHQGWKDLKRIHDVDAVSGAFLFIRREVFDTIGLFDEGFFMYAEDLDFCLRMKKAGLAIGFNPDASALHLKGKSGRTKNGNRDDAGRKKTEYYFWDTMQTFYKKHYYDKYFRPLSWLVIATINNRKKKYS